MSTIDSVTALVVLAIAFMVFCASAAVVRFYAQARRSSPTKHGLLLWHVLCVATSVCGVWFVLALGQLDILGVLMTPRWTRLVGYGVFGVLTLVSLFLIAVATRRRVHRGPICTTVTEQRSTVIDDGNE